MIDGVSIRLPTICVRPGKPNLAASGFFSGIIREPLNGKEAILPVSTEVRHWHATPRSAAGFLIHAAELDTSKLNNRITLNMPGLSVTVQEQIEALGRVAGNDVVKLIKHQSDPVIKNIVNGWARNFSTKRSLELGFKAETTFDEIIQIYIEDDLKKLLKVGGKLFVVLGSKNQMHATLILRETELIWNSKSLFETHLEFMKGHEPPKKFFF